MERGICFLLGYGLGLFQTAYIYGRMHGIDIREHGSGNAGTTNALRVLGKKAGLLVFAGDFLKCVLAVAAARLLYGGAYDGAMEYLLCLYGAAGAIIGHNFPFYMGFKGGKGIAATAGLIAAFHPYFIPVGLILFVSAFGISHYVSLGSLLVYVGFVAQMVIMGQAGLFAPSTPSQLLELYALALALALMAFWRHRENIRRLLAGTENKTYLGKKT